MSDPRDAETEAEAPPERLHILSVLSGIGTALRQMIGAFLAGGFFAFQGRISLGIMIVGGLVCSIVIGMLLHWWRFSYRVGGDALRIDSGIVSRNHRVIPFDRVADVSLTQGPLQRLVGVAKVTLETGGGSSLSGEEGVLGAVALERAEALRDHVRARRAVLASSLAPTTEAPAQQPPDGRRLFGMDGKRVLTCGLFNFSLALFAGLFGITQTAGDALKVDPFEREFWAPLLVDSGLGDWLLEHRLGLAIGGVVVLILAGIVTGLVRTVLREWDFQLERTGSGLRRRRGLLTKTDVTLPLRRVQAGVIDTGPLRQRFGWYSLSVKSLAGESGSGPGDKKDHALAPLAAWAELQPIAGEFGWRLPDEQTGWKPVARAHVWSFALLLGPIFALLGAGGAAALMLAPPPSPEALAGTGLAGQRDLVAALLLGSLIAGLFLLLMLLRWLEWKRTFYALQGSRLMIRTGWWNRQTLLLPLRNVQTADLRETGLSRLFGIAHVVVGVAGGNLAGHRIPSLPRKEAAHLRRILLTQQP